MNWIKQNWFNIVVVSLLILIFVYTKNSGNRELPQQSQVIRNNYCDSQEILARLDTIEEMLNNIKKNQISLLSGNVDLANGQVDIISGQSDILAQIRDFCR